MVDKNTQQQADIVVSQFKEDGEEDSRGINFVPPAIPKKTKRITKKREFVPTTEQRALVMNLAIVGASVDRIAAHLAIDDETVTRYFGPELMYGEESMLANVFGSLYRAALSGDTKAAIFIMQTKGGWHQGIGDLVNVQINFAAEDLKL